MKKSTKIITTAIALVLVLGFMIVGIYAATSASSNISASISWTAEKGVKFTLDAWTYYSAEHYDENSKSFPTLSTHKIDQISVDSATTNQAASGITKSLNATFIDTTDDGVNNPHALYYCYVLGAVNSGLSWSTLGVEVNFPMLTTQNGVKVELLLGEDDYMMLCSNPESSGFDKLDSETSHYEFYDITSLSLVFKLTLDNPNTSLEQFDASVSFDIERGNDYEIL